MDKDVFTDQATGQLARIEIPWKGPDWAFIPDALPRWEFDQEIWPLLVEARDRLATLNGLGQGLDDPELLLRPLQQREAIASSAIEGTFVTPQQLMLYEMNPKEPTSAADSRADWREVLNYSHALEAGCMMLDSLPIGGHIVRSMHGILMQGVRGRDKSPGQFRTVQVQVGSTGRFIPPPAIEVPRLMQNLEEYVSADHKIDPLVKAFIVHYQFEAIHPFEDGNGRVGRAILALMIHKHLNHTKPWLYLSAFFNEFRDEYVENLFRVSANGEWGNWIRFCLRATIAQANDSIDRCQRFDALKKEFQIRILDANPSPRSASIVDGLFKEPITTIPNLKERYQVTYHTARADIDRLRAVGILDELPGLRPKSFYSPEIMSIAFDSTS